MRLADNRRMCVATPAYLAKHGSPKIPSDLLQHSCLTLSSDASQTRGWAFKAPPSDQAEGSEVTYLRPHGPLDCSDGQVLHGWCLADMGIAWRSTWEVERTSERVNWSRCWPNLPRRPTAFTAFFPKESIYPCVCGFGSTF